MCGAIHGKSQNARQKALNDFKTSKTNVIVATDIAARDIDIKISGIVVNYDLRMCQKPMYTVSVVRAGLETAVWLSLSVHRKKHRCAESIQKALEKKLSQVSIPA